MIKFNQLRVFHGVGKTEKIVGSSKRPCVTQAAVSA